MTWIGQTSLEPITYVCGYCDRTVGGAYGYSAQYDKTRAIYVCPFCSKPTYFHYLGQANVMQYPGVAFGEAVGSLPADVERLYAEARACTSVGAFTAAVLVCRKILMHAAVSLGAKKNSAFADYVQWLVDEGHFPKKGRATFLGISMFPVGPRVFYVGIGLVAAILVGMGVGIRSFRKRGMEARPLWILVVLYGILETLLILVVILGVPEVGPPFGF